MENTGHPPLETQETQSVSTLPVKRKKPSEHIQQADAECLCRRDSKYDAVIDNFLKADTDSARITYEGTKDSMLAIGLRQRIKVRELKNLQVKYRSEKGVYLLKKK